MPEQTTSQQIRSLRQKLKSAEAANRTWYRDGIEAAADFASSWDSQISGTKFTFGDIIRGKFNLIGKRKLRKQNYWMR